jgi:hypothetical protein
MIPRYLSNIIWEALTDVPNIQAGRTRLQEVFTQPPSYDDNLNAIRSHKKDTSPGMFIGSFFKIIIITSVKQIINYLIEKMLIKIGISEVVITIIIFLI